MSIDEEGRLVRQLSVIGARMLRFDLTWKKHFSASGESHKDYQGGKVRTRKFFFIESVLRSTCFLFLSTFALAASAQTFPSRPITVIFPFPSGTATDAAYRLINAEVSKTLGQPVVLEVRSGANARLGVQAVRAAPGDGHLLAVVNESILVSQPIADPGFKLEIGKDYAPVGWQFEFPLVMLVRLGLPFNNLKGLIQYAKANPGKLNFAHSPTTLFPAERIRQVADIDVTLVPYKGAEMLLDMVGGRVDATIAGGTAASFVNSGKLQAIATTGVERWDAFPGTPTLKEAGLPVEYTVWYGLVAAPGTPAEVVQKLNTAFALALQSPEVAKALKGYGYFGASRDTSPAEFGGWIKSLFGVWEPIIRKAGIKMN